MNYSRVQMAKLRRFFSQEAGRYPNIKSVRFSLRGAGIDVVFQVEGDLFEGERSSFRVLDALAETFEGIPYDFIVLPPDVVGVDRPGHEDGVDVYERANA